MSTPNEQDLSGITQTARIIVGSLATGLTIFLVICVAVIRPEPADEPFLTWAGLALAAVALIASNAVRRLIADQGKRQIAGEPAGDRPGSLLSLYQTQLVAGAALIEGGGFFALICYFIEGSMLALGAGLLMIVALASLFPTRDRIERWVEARLVEVDQLGQLPE